MYKYKITELNNGLRIITVPNKDKRTCLFKIIVKTGAEYEKYDQQGISHFIEHTFFKGTKEKTKQEIYTEVESYGGKINGRTDNLITQYFI
ncbi:MAG: insulinase family protein [Candidatus Pacebacteria bacterium]|nr:insulinase family protein [Candidatus Paceibacterota bacterium]